MSGFCTRCGAALAAGTNFCTACGAPVAAARQPIAPEPASAPPAIPVAPPPSHLGKRRAILVAGLVAGGALLAAVLIAIGPDAPKSPQPPRPTATAPPAAPPAATVIAANRWERYTNIRYGVTIDYPADLFSAEPPPPDNAGRSFNAPALKARFHIYSHANAFGASVDELQAEDVLDIGDERAVQRKGADWYSVIGLRNRDPHGERITRRVLLSEGGTMVHRLEIAYPPAMAKAFEPIVARMTQSLKVDPGIPEKAANAAETKPAAPPAKSAPPARPAGDRGWQSIDTISLGLKTPRTKGMAGLALQIPGDWKRVPLPEQFLLEFAGPADSGNAKLRLLIEALRVPSNISLAREAEAIKSTIKPGVENYKEQNEANVTVALRPARRLTLIFQSMDEPALQRQEYLLVRAGETVFKILVQGPEAETAAIRRLFDRVVETLAVAE